MSEHRTHHNTCPRGERCACYLTGYTDAEYDHGLALDTLEPAKSDLASSTGYPTWCNHCQALSVGHLHSSGIYIPACPHDSKERRVWQLLKDIEQHCPCGARPESLNTHPHVTGCPVSEALELMADNDSRSSTDTRP